VRIRGRDLKIVIVRSLSLRALLRVPGDTRATGFLDTSADGGSVGISGG
jgi:hypothetical protein